MSIRWPPLELKGTATYTFLYPILPIGESIIVKLCFTGNKPGFMANKSRGQNFPTFLLHVKNS